MKIYFYRIRIFLSNENIFLSNENNFYRMQIYFYRMKIIFIEFCYISATIEPHNRHSKNQNAIIVIKSELKESEQEKAKDNIIGHVPNALAQNTCPFLKDGTVTSMTSEITAEARKAPEGTWVLGGGIELPCVYYLFGNRKREAQVWKQIGETQSALCGASS